MSGHQLPASIGRYRPLNVLGTGAMGTVYRAHDPVIDRNVAIKVVRTETLDGDLRAEFIERFRREVQAAGRCSHANIVGVFDFSGDAANPFIVMELVEGRTLHGLMRDPDTRGALEIVPLLCRVLDALGYAHSLGITHRDMKPANILVTAAGVPKIADFGIARLSGSSMTQAGSMLGTPSYMAPEQVTDDNVDHRADLFAVGCMLYEFYAGMPPFGGRNLSDTILRVTGPAPADMQPIEAAGAFPLIPVLQRALAKQRSDRFQSAEEFAAALQGRAGRAPAGPVPGMTLPNPTFGPRPPAGSLDGRWDPEMLQRIERALARHVGPMARVMVNQAARQSATADELLETLARSLETPADRTVFRRAAGERSEPTLATQTRAGQTTVGLTGVGQRPFTPDQMAATQIAPSARTQTPAGTLAGGTVVTQPMIEAAQAALVVYVGPMARVMARKAAAQAVSTNDFIDRLCANVDKPAESTALRRKLRAEIEARQR